MDEETITSPKTVLLTSVVGPLGPAHGDGPSVGYELLHGQITRAQGIFSPRAVHVNFSLNYIAENIGGPAVVLQYPMKNDLIRELKRNSYDYIGISFIMALFHRLKETVEIIRKYAPKSQIVLGGYGTILPDDVLAPWGDHICREEGVAFFRRLLERPEIPMPYKHPKVLSTLKVFSMEVSRTGMIFAGLGCPNGCDFCCTSHFFKRKHVRLLPEGKDIFNVIESYLEDDPDMSFVILDEDFLLSKPRAMAFRDAVLRSGKALSIFVFSSVKAISQYTVEEILEMGIDGFWIGYEGTRSGYAKQQGRPTADIFKEFRQHGITILASMILGFDYQNREVVAEELTGLMALKPSFSQFLIYGPTPGTPFYDRIMKENLLRDDLAADKLTYYRKCDGFAAMVKHPTMSPKEIEDLQRWCYDEDFARLGPSLFRTVESWLLGYQKLKDSPNPMLRRRADRFAREVRNAYPIFGVGKWFGPNRAVRQWIADLERRVKAEFGPATFSERLMSVGAFPAAIWTYITLKLGIFQHPKVRRTVYGASEVDALLESIKIRVEEPALP